MPLASKADGTGSPPYVTSPRASASGLPFSAVMICPSPMSVRLVPLLPRVSILKMYLRQILLVVRHDSARST